MRKWELRGLVRCGCGKPMRTQISNSNGRVYHYCKGFRRADYKRGVCTRQFLPALAAEAAVWGFVFGLVKDREAAPGVWTR